MRSFQKSQGALLWSQETPLPTATSSQCRSVHTLVLVTPGPITFLLQIANQEFLPGAVRGGGLRGKRRDWRALYLQIQHKPRPTKQQGREKTKWESAKHSWRLALTKAEGSTFSFFRESNPRFTTSPLLHCFTLGWGWILSREGARRKGKELGLEQEFPSQMKFKIKLRGLQSDLSTRVLLFRFLKFKTLQRGICYRRNVFMLKKTNQQQQKKPTVLLLLLLFLNAAGRLVAFQMQ